MGKFKPILRLPEETPDPIAIIETVLHGQKVLIKRYAEIAPPHEEPLDPEEFVRFLDISFIGEEYVE